MARPARQPSPLERDLVSQERLVQWANQVETQLILDKMREDIVKALEGANMDGSESSVDYVCELTRRLQSLRSMRAVMSEAEGVVKRRTAREQQGDDT